MMTLIPSFYFDLSPPMVGSFQSRFDLPPPMVGRFQSRFDLLPPMEGSFQSNFVWSPPMEGRFQSKLPLRNEKNIPIFNLILNYKK